MDSRKLFQLLVVGGALVAGGCREEQSTELSDAATTDAVVIREDASDGAATDAPAALEDAGAVELINCGICPNTECCETDAAGASHTRDGMECCWGTAC